MNARAVFSRDKNGIGHMVFWLLLGLSPVVPAAEAVHDHSAMQASGGEGGERDPHANADGYDFGPYHLHLADHHSFYSLLVDNLEAVQTDAGTSAAYDVQAWYGRDYDRLLFKAEGDAEDGRLTEGRSELLWSHAVAAFWNGQVGVRHDQGLDPSRSWLGIGAQGLAPYWFELDSTFYVSDAGHTALRIAGEYELLLTQRLILQPRLETNIYGKRDAARQLGSGLSDLAIGLRLRYELRRSVAPYVGVEWRGRFGGSADAKRSAGEDATETRLVTGLRLMF